MTENSPNLVREKVTQVQEVQRVPIKINIMSPILRHIIIKMTKVKDKEVERNKQLVTYKGLPIRL